MTKALSLLLLPIILISLLFEIAPEKAYGAGIIQESPDSGKKLAVMVILDRINIEDLAGDYPNIRRLMEKGASALMNTSTSVRMDHASSYLTIGAGTRAYAGGIDEAFGYNEEYGGQKAGKVFTNYTGIKPLRQNLVVPDMPRIIQENSKLDHETVPGLLGEILKNHGIPVAVLGNADFLDEKNRPAALIAMDCQGIIASGDVSRDLLVNDDESPFFVKTDYEKLYQKFVKYARSGGLIIIHPGDTVRANDYLNLANPQQYEHYRKKALKDADAFIGRLMRNMNLAQDLLMVITPFPSTSGYRQRNLLTPFIAAGPGIKPGFATSATTRRPGLVANIDIAPTILEYFNIPAPVIMLGHTVLGVGTENITLNSLEYFIRMNRGIVATYTQRAYLIKPYVAMQIFVSLGFLLLVFLRKNRLKTLRPFILANMAIPLSFLLLPLVASDKLFSKYLWLVLLTTGIVLVSLRFMETLRSIIFICLSTSSGILLDLLVGAPLMKLSILGYDSIGGARYYGLGNEYMGVLIGSFTTGITALIDESRMGSRKKTSLSILCAVLFTATVYLIFSPRYGSNVGGFISAYGAFTITILMLLGIRVKSSHLGPIAAGMVLFIVLLLAATGSSNPPSHISQTLASVKVHGMMPLWDIVGRKLSMNLKLLKYTPWTRALLTSIGVIVALFYRPPHILKNIFQKYHNLYSGFVGAGTGCLLALIFNDSGIVAAATMMVYIALPLLLLVIDEIPQS